MTFIWLTRDDGLKIAVNPAFITFVTRDTEAKYTDVGLAVPGPGGNAADVLCVEELPNDIVRECLQRDQLADVVKALYEIRGE